MTATIIIVTGTRLALADRHRDLVAAELAGQERTARVRGHMRLVHGDAPGLDKLARDIVRPWGWDVDPVPADWEHCGPNCPQPVPHDRRQHRRARHDGTTYCPLAGPRRNRVMVDRYGPGALGVLGFPALGADGRSGTWDCLHYAVEQGVPILGITALEVA